MTESLNDKVVIITGASSGIGEASARLLAERGCKLTLAARSIDKMESLAAELSTETLVVGVDLTDPDDITDLVERTMERFGRIDVMLANAGVYVPGQFADGDIDAYSMMLKLNVDAVFRCAHAVIPIMKAQGGGDIVVTSSISGHVDIVGEPVYSASKHAVQTFVHTLRRQVAEHGIRVMSLAPGPVANPMQWLYEPAEQKHAVEVAGSHLASEDCADAILFMLSRPPHVTIRDLVILPQMNRV
ncbi:MAG: SDR family oxidoreductase [Chloroflexota bacterium]|nr:SDR family oxidoreductase [Chloroflexota bacterium]